MHSVISFRSATPLWVAVAFAAAAAVSWLLVAPRLTHRYQWMRITAVIATLGATLVGVLMPVSPPAGFVPAIATVNPLLGFEQLMGIDHAVWDKAISQVWSAGNLVLLWPLMAALLANGLSRSRVLTLVASLDLAIEVTQGLVRPLGRSFEISDLVMNLSGAALFLLISSWVTRSRLLEGEAAAGNVLEDQTRLG